MAQGTAFVLFESTTNPAVLEDPVNEDWVAVLEQVTEDSHGVLARCYYLGLRDFRSRTSRPGLPGQPTIVAKSRQQALEGMLQCMEQRKARTAAGEREVAEVLVDPSPANEDDLPAALRDFTVQPPLLTALLEGAGRPPCDALCLLRAFLAAPLLGVGDSPTAVHRLLHSNPTFAHHCGFLGRKVLKQSGELTSRRLPSQAVCEEFSEVMTRYGLWHRACVEQVRKNFAAGVVEVEDTVVFDTTHIEAYSHCDNVIPPDAEVEAGKKPKHRKVPRMRKCCGCGQEAWETCEHPWIPTDPGAAVVVKGPTRIYWAHKASVASFGDSELPFDVRVCRYGAEHDGKTLLPHLKTLTSELPESVERMRYVLADDAYQENRTAVADFGLQARLVVPVHGCKPRSKLLGMFDGIDDFTPSGVPVCQAGHPFEMRGRDLSAERYIWAAPDDVAGQPVCASCPCADRCPRRGARRHIRVPRALQPQINWDHPQHFVGERALYNMRPGVERAIKRLKVDLHGEHLTHRDALRVQAHLDRKLLILHLLLSSSALD